MQPCAVTGEIVVFVHLSDVQRQLYERLLASNIARSVVSGRTVASESALLLIGEAVAVQCDVCEI